MANLLSAKKRIRSTAKREERNKARKSAVKTEIRKFNDAVHDGQLDAAKEQFRKLTKKLDQTAAKGALHKNTVSRKKSRLAKRLNAAVAAKK